MMTFVKLAAGVAALYLVAVVLMALAQDWLLFPRWAMARTATPVPAAAERLTLETASGAEVVGIHLPAIRPPAGDAALILGFGGNAWDADELATHLQSVHPDRDVVTFHYRGYPPSTGRPSAAALLEDAVAIHDHLMSTLAPARIVACCRPASGPGTRSASRWATRCTDTRSTRRRPRWRPASAGS